MDVASVTPDLAQADQRRVTTLGRQVRAALAGDEAAFEAIVEARLPRTYRIALAILGSEADARDAEDRQGRRRRLGDRVSPRGDALRGPQSQVRLDGLTGGTEGPEPLDLVARSRDSRHASATTPDRAT